MRMSKEPPAQEVARDESGAGQNVLDKAIRHEENLINPRLTGLLTFQGFLFAAAALATDGSRAAILTVVPWVGSPSRRCRFLECWLPTGRLRRLAGTAQ